MSGTACGADHVGSAHVCGTSGARDVGVSNMARCPYCSKNLVVRVGSLRGAGTGKVWSVGGQEKTVADDLRWKNSGFSLCPPASWPSKRPWPTPPPKLKRSSVLQSTLSAWKPAGLPVPPTRRLPLQSTKG